MAIRRRTRKPLDAGRLILTEQQRFAAFKMDFVRLR
jgi:hypothetical protein